MNPFISQETKNLQFSNKHNANSLNNTWLVKEKIMKL